MNEITLSKFMNETIALAKTNRAINHFITTMSSAKTGGKQRMRTLARTCLLHKVGTHAGIEKNPLLLSL